MLAANYFEFASNPELYDALFPEAVKARQEAEEKKQDYVEVRPETPEEAMDVLADIERAMAGIELPDDEDDGY